MTGHSLEKAIKKEFSGDIMEGLIAICRCVCNKAEYFASRLHKSMAGIGTNDKQLIRVIITRCEVRRQQRSIEQNRKKFKLLFCRSIWVKLRRPMNVCMAKAWKAGSRVIPRVTINMPSMLWWENNVRRNKKAKNFICFVKITIFF